MPSRHRTPSGFGLHYTSHLRFERRDNWAEFETSWDARECIIHPNVTLHGSTRWWLWYTLGVVYIQHIHLIGRVASSHILSICRGLFFTCLKEMYKVIIGILVVSAIPWAFLGELAAHIRIAWRLSFWSRWHAQYNICTSNSVQKYDLIKITGERSTVLNACSCGRRLPSSASAPGFRSDLNHLRGTFPQHIVKKTPWSS